MAEIVPPFTRRITTRNFKFSLFISVDEIREYRNRILDRPILLDFIYIYIVTYSKVMVIEAQKSTETSFLFFLFFFSFFFFHATLRIVQPLLSFSYEPATALWRILLHDQTEKLSKISIQKKKIHKNELHGGKKIF